MTLRFRTRPGLSPDAEAFVASHADDAFATGAGFRAAIADTYRIPTLTIEAWDDGRRVGVAPWHVMVSPTGTTYLTLGPFASWADPIAPDPHVAAALLDRSRTVARMLGLGYVQVRSRRDLDPRVDPRDRIERERFVSPTVHLDPDPDRLFASLGSRARQFVRKAQRLGVTATTHPDAAAVEAVFASGMRSIGSPFHGRAFFEALRHRLGADCVETVAWYRGQPAAAALGVVAGDTMHYVYGQNVRELRPTCANTLVLWHLMVEASRRGLRAFDLGRSELGSPQLRFKRQWRPDDVPLVGYRLAARARSLPDLAPTNPTFARAQRIWRTLPLPLTRALGPWIVRGIG